MNILCVIDSLGSGGAQRQLVELAKGFKRRGHKVTFLTYHSINFFKEDLDGFLIPVLTVIEENHFRRIIKVRKAIRNIDPDSVISFLEAANFMVTLAGIPFRKWRLIVGERSANPKITKSLKLRFFRFFHLFVDYVVSNSYENIKFVKKANPLIKNEKFKTIYNIANGYEIKQAIFQNECFTNILVVASYREVKNLHGLIMAVNSLPNEYKAKLRIHWYGNISMDNDYFIKNYKLIRKLELDTIFLLNDNVKNIAEKYTQSDFVGLFSHYEGFPNSICEAMAAKKPVIVSAISDIPIFIKENENGFLCNSEDFDSIKNAIIKAINSSQRQRDIMGRNNCEKANLQFNEEVIVSNYLKLMSDSKN